MAADGELERVLRDIFGGEGSLGDVDPTQQQNVHQVPGIAYAGGPQPQRGGPAGQVAQAYSDWLNSVYGGVNPSKCPPPFNDPDCMNVLSRLLEGTFRNFQLTARPPSHLAPPFPAVPFDVDGYEVRLLGGTYAPGAWTPVVCYTMPAIKCRGVVTEFGHALESLLAWADVEWEIRKNGIPVEPWTGIRKQIWDIVEPGKSSTRVLLLPRDRICIYARSLSGTTHYAWARMAGWYYPVRSEVGGTEIRATLVD